MEIVKKTVRYKSRSELFEVWPIGDCHLGNIGCDVKKLKETVDLIKDNPRAYVILMGDICESITMSDKRFDPRSIDKHYHITDLSHLIRRQLDDAIEILLPLKGKILGALAGNHEEKIRLTSSYDISSELARALDTPYMGYNGFINLNFSRQTSPKHTAWTQYVFYIHHGHAGGRRSGSKINALEDAAHIFDCDCVIQGARTQEDNLTANLKIGIRPCRESYAKEAVRHNERIVS